MDSDLETRPEQYLDSEYLQSLPVYPLVHNIKHDLLESIDTALTWKQLTASDVNFAIIRPLVYKYVALKNMAAVPACLLVRSYFLDLAQDSLPNAPLHLSRASLAEILATKLLRFFSSSQLELAAVLTTTWDPLTGASPAVVGFVESRLERSPQGYVENMSTLELAIATESKHFLSTPMVQAIVESIYSGRIVFSTFSTRSILADNYKIRAIEFYDVSKAPFLDHYRLRVPRYRFVLDFLRFVFLFLTYVICISNRNLANWNLSELIFVTFALAFVFDEYASCFEYGWRMYIANLWNVFDSAWIIIFCAYAVCRGYGLRSNDESWSELGFDFLACGACILFPRLAFFLVTNQVVIIALRGMIAEFAVFLSIAVLCFSGLLFTLWILGSKGGTWTLKSIAWLMTQVWFGNSFLSFNQAESFHEVFGPVLMVMFAALSNTLLLTILISILSNTYARIDANANHEFLFQFTIRTIENVKSEAMFSYQPPINLLAYAILRPLSWCLTPRALHRVNVALIRLTSFPILVIIAIYERCFAIGMTTGQKRHLSEALQDRLPRKLKAPNIFDTFTGSRMENLLGAVFDADEELPDERFMDFADSSLADLPQTPTVDHWPTFEGTRRSHRQPPRRPRNRRTTRSKSSSQSRRAPPQASVPVLLGAKPEHAILPSFSSPLAKLFGGSTNQAMLAGEVKQSTSESAMFAGQNGEHSADLLKDLHGLVEEWKSTSMGSLQTQLNEMQLRQERIESLLVSLTRSMRTEGPD